VGGLGALAGGALLVLAALACDPQPAPPPAASLLPADYAGRFITARDCRPSIDHDLRHIVIKVEPALAGAYERGPYPLPAGTLIIKEEYADADCTDRQGWTLMHKQPAGYDDRYGNWRWQRLDARGAVLEDGPLPRCASCHAASACRARDFACAEPDPPGQAGGLGREP
jgi:hypothetical protein